VWDMARRLSSTFVYPVLGHPMMRPDAGFVEFISFSFFYPSPLVNLLDCARLTLSRMVLAEGSHPHRPLNSSTKGYGGEDGKPRRE
jgi:hypothetical protein